VDLSGTLHVGDVPTPGAAAAIRRLREAGVVLRWLSNTSKESKQSLLAKMKRMELDVRDEELFTSLSAVAALVRERNYNPLYILSESALEDFPPSSPPYNSVVVGLAPERLSYPVLNEAFRLLAPEGAATPPPPLVATHKALYYRSADGGLSLGPGPFITALEEASGVKAEVVGKPTSAFFRLALESLLKDGIDESHWTQVGMVGDDRRQDVGPVTASLRLKRYLVQTGKYRPGDEDRITDDGTARPEWVGASFAQVADDVLGAI